MFTPVSIQVTWTWTLVLSPVHPTHGPHPKQNNVSFPRVVGTGGNKHLKLAAPLSSPVLLSLSQLFQMFLNSRDLISAILISSHLFSSLLVSSKLFSSLLRISAFSHLFWFFSHIFTFRLIFVQRPSTLLICSPRVSTLLISSRLISTSKCSHPFSAHFISSRVSYSPLSTGDFSSSQLISALFILVPTCSTCR